MLFSHSPQVLDQVPQPSVAILSVTGVTAALDVADTTRLFLHRNRDLRDLRWRYRTPEAGEVIFADDAGHAHARRWTNRQSGRSAITMRYGAERLDLDESNAA